MKPDLRTVPSDLPDPPYPADTKAGSFAFDVEVDRLLASDTWVLVSDVSRPWCLMSWVVSWSLIPCGSLPSDDSVIAARLGCDQRFFDGHRDEILRGWMLHNDGRLYHPVVTEKVIGFLGTRKKWRSRKRGKSSTGSPGGVSVDSKGSLGGVSGGSPPSSSSSSSSSPSLVSPPSAKEAPRIDSEDEKKPTPTARSAKRGTRLKHESLTREWREYCAKKRPDLDPMETWERFRDYWIAVPGSKGCKLDWAATWRNWVRNESYGNGRNGKSGGNGSAPRTDQQWIDWANSNGCGARPGETMQSFVSRARSMYEREHAR